MAEWEDMAVVGRMARPHGIRGQVIVNPETDFVKDRFGIGARFWTRTASGDEQVTVASARIQQGRPVVLFEGFDSIEAVERFAGCELRVPEDTLHPLEPGTYYHHRLIGCTVVTVGGVAVGAVTGVQGGSGVSLLVVAGRRGEVLVPLASHICVDIDVDARRIRIDPPEGLLELNESAP